MNSSATENLAPPRPAAAPPPAAPAIDRPVRLLIIGYGNTLRRDDGAGPAIVARLEAQFAGNPRVRFISAHQLLPELALELTARRVFFIDASVQLPSGAIQVRRLRALRPGRAPVTHHLAGPRLLALAAALYGRAPAALSIAIGAGDLSAGEGLSPAPERAARALVVRLARRIGREPPAFPDVTH